MARAIINRRAVDGADIEVTILGADLQGFESITYEETPATQLNRAKGRKPYSYSIGGPEYSGSITLYHDTVSEIEAALEPGKSLLDILPFPIVVRYVASSGRIVKDIVTASFKKMMRGGGTSDLGLKYEYELFVVDIQWNAA
jgi:hypothetical protein